MNYAIDILKSGKSKQEEILTNYINTLPEKQSSLHFEHIADIKEELKEINNAIFVLNNINLFADKDIVNKLIEKVDYLENLIRR